MARISEIKEVRFDAYYSGDFFKSNPKSIRYQIDRKIKKGNHDLFNKIFEHHDKLWMHRAAPPEIADYIAYVFGTSVGDVSWLPIAFETTTFAYPHGIVKTFSDNQDVMLFKIVDGIGFEVYILKGKRYDSINYLQLLIDGHLEKAIQEIKLRD